MKNKLWHNVMVNIKSKNNVNEETGQHQDKFKNELK